MVLLQIDFPFAGPFGEQLADQLQALAQSINDEPGLIRKIWTENAQTQEAGGIYLFTDKNSAQAYQAKHTERLVQMGVARVNAKLFDVNPTLSAINGADVS